MTFQGRIDLAPPIEVKPFAGPKPRSLVAQVGLKMILLACLCTIIVSVLGYRFVVERAERRALSSLSEYLAERGRAESRIFAEAEDNVRTFRDRFIALYRDPRVLPSADFDRYYFEPGDGTIRLREEFFRGVRDSDGLIRSGTSAFVGRERPPLTDELKRRLVLAYKLVDEYGPGWIGNFSNLHASLPENALVIHWPDAPWGLDAKADLNLVAGSVIRSTLQQENPSRKPVWTGLYYDLTAKHWTVTHELPVDLDGKHLITPSLDIRLDDMIAGMIAHHPAGAQNLILASNGDLVAHPERIDEMRQNQGVLNVATLGDPKLLQIYQSIVARSSQAPEPGGVHIALVPELDAYIGFTELEGPGWWFVTLYPRKLIDASAYEAARGLLLILFSLFALTTLIVIIVLRTSVARPINQVKLASERLAAGDYLAIADGSVRLPEELNNEIGLLARSFRAMAVRAGDAKGHLEQSVTARTLELEIANRKLEQLSFVDGLTSAYNRRAFDLDLGAAIAEAKSGKPRSALLLCDIDCFKLYNDSYGHEAGDQVLRTIVETMARAVPGNRVYRYGGEELAVILHPDQSKEWRMIGTAVVEAIAALKLPHRASELGFVSISGGLARIGNNVSSAPDIIKAADILLYQAKQQGRNRLVDSLHPFREAAA